MFSIDTSGLKVPFNFDCSRDNSNVIVIRKYVKWGMLCNDNPFSLPHPFHVLYFVNFVSPTFFFLFYRIIQPPPQSQVWFVDKWTDEPFLYDAVGSTWIFNYVNSVASLLWFSTRVVCVWWMGCAYPVWLEFISGLLFWGKSWFI